MDAINLNKKILEKLNYVRDHPYASAWLKGEGKSEVTFSNVDCNEEDKSVFNIEISDLTFAQAKDIIEKIKNLRLDEEVYRE